MEDILDHEYTEGEFEFFREFLNLEEARDMANILEQYNILYKLEEPRVIIDQAIVGHSMLPKVILKILTRDFQRVNTILASIIETQEIPNQHYLLDFSDLELFEVLKKPDNWNVEDITLSKKILVDRGFEITDEQINQLQRERYGHLKAGKKGNLQWIAFYGACIIIGVVFLHPLFLLAGAGMGLYYWRDQNTDPSGERYFTFEKNTRNIGQFIFYIGIFLTVVLFIWLFYSANSDYWIFYR